MIDNADPLRPGETFEAINRLSTGPWSFSTIIASRNGLGLGDQVVTLSPLARPFFEELLAQMFEGSLDAAGM